MDSPMDGPEALARANIAYRRPELYDALTANDDQAAVIADIVGARHANARTVLDLGCGTGRDLAALHDRCGWDVVGVDLQPHLIAYARTTRPGLDLRTGDLRTVRLGRTFDVITCLGNTLAYLHTDDDLTAAAATFAAHAHRGTVVIIATLNEPPTARSPGTHEIRTSEVDAKVDVRSVLDASTRFLTTHRTWTFHDGATTTDLFVRRVIGSDELRRLLRAQDFTCFDAGPPSVATFSPGGVRT